MKKILINIAFLTLFASTLSTSAIDVANVVRAQVVLGQVSKVVDKYQKVQTLIDAGAIGLKAPKPIQGSKGDYMFPYSADGNINPWGEKALTAQVGSKVGEKVAEEGVKALASKIPFGGLFAGAAKKQAKSSGAVLAIGGWDFIKENTDMSFDELRDLSVYMHSKFYGNENYETALAAAMGIYPELEKEHEKAISRAYKKLKKSRAYKKALKKAAKDKKSAS